MNDRTVIPGWIGLLKFYVIGGLSLVFSRSVALMLQSCVHLSVVCDVCIVAKQCILQKKL